MKSNCKPSSISDVLQKKSPKHDSPIGLLHPYWARKPLNIIDEIITAFSSQNDTVLDPFVGSGTVGFSALANKRNLIASDLNPLSIFITTSVIELSQITNSELDFIIKFYNEIEDDYISLYACGKTKLIERIRYDVNGEYKNGKFKLVPSEIICKEIRQKKWVGKEVINFFKLPNITSHYNSYLNSPIKFKEIDLLENSRIAIPKGSKLSHFFDDRNQITINLIFKKIKASKASQHVKDILLFILSSSIPLLRLSDKKASSQWPFWRPKNSLTSRNPKFVLEKRVKAIVEAHKWAKGQIPASAKVSLQEFYRSKEKKYILVQSAAQDLLKKGIKNESIDLILTDPPYADQVPYLEYSALWNHIILQKPKASLYKDEIVKTDAPERKQDSDNYIKRFCDAFSVCCDTLKNNGYLIFFYQDRNLNHWDAINDTLKHKSVYVMDVIAIPKQRRSMKSVMSPGRTLDGDLLVVCKKDSSRNVVRSTRKFSFPKLTGSFFQKYSQIIRYGLVNSYIGDLAKINNDVFELIDKG